MKTYWFIVMVIVGILASTLRADDLYKELDGVTFAVKLDSVSPKGEIHVSLIPTTTNTIAYIGLTISLTQAILAEVTNVTAKWVEKKGIQFIFMNANNVCVYKKYLFADS